LIVDPDGKIISQEGVKKEESGIKKPQRKEKARVKTPGMKKAADPFI